MSDKLRRGWLAARRDLRLDSNELDDFACGGLASLTDGPPDLRVVVLPADPFGDRVPLNDGTGDWWRNDPALAEARRIYGGDQRTVSNALLLHSYPRTDHGGFRNLMALHRSGVVEAMLGSATWEQDGTRYLSLMACKGAIRACLDTAMHVSARWDVEGPFHITMGVRRTSAMLLGDFDRSWARTWTPRQAGKCIEANVVTSIESAGPLDPGALSDELADRIENAFGTTRRRHLPRPGTSAASE